MTSWFNWPESMSTLTTDQENVTDNSENTSNQVGQALEGVVAGIKSQTRFKLLSGWGHNRLNTETVAGIKDMTLGKLKNGVKVGEFTKVVIFIN